MSDATQGTGKKGLGTGAWIAIGCGGVALIAIIAVALVLGWGLFKAKEIAEEFGDNPAQTAAETVIRLNPDLELIDSDEEAGTITFRNEKTGEEATLNFEEIAQGRFSMKTAEGEYRVDASDVAEEGAVTFEGPEGEARIGVVAGRGDAPDWIPVYPGATGVQTGYSASTAEQASGIVTCATEDGPSEVIEHYEGWFERNGYEVTGRSSSRTPQGSFSAIAGELAADGRTLHVGVVEQAGATRVTINYSDRSE